MDSPIGGHCHCPRLVSSFMLLIFCRPRCLSFTTWALLTSRWPDFGYPPRAHARTGQAKQQCPDKWATVAYQERKCKPLSLIHKCVFIINFADIKDLSTQFTNNKITNVCKIYNHIYNTLLRNSIWPVDSHKMLSLTFAGLSYLYPSHDCN